MERNENDLKDQNEGAEENCGLRKGAGESAEPQVSGKTVMDGTVGLE